MPDAYKRSLGATLRAARFAAGTPRSGNVHRVAAVGALGERVDDPPLVERFDVRSVPLFVLFADGEPVARRAEGFIPGDDLTAWVDERVE